MKAWGWGFVSFAAFWFVISGIKGWQFSLLLLAVGLLMIWRGRGGSDNGNSENDKSTK